MSVRLPVSDVLLKTMRKLLYILLSRTMKSYTEIATYYFSQFTKVNSVFPTLVLIMFTYCVFYGTAATIQLFTFGNTIIDKE